MNRFAAALVLLTLCVSKLIGQDTTLSYRHQAGTTADLFQMLSVNENLFRLDLTNKDLQRTVRVAEATCHMLFPADTSEAHYKCLLTMRDAIAPPAQYGPCTNKPEKRDGEMKCWREDLTTGGYDWFPAGIRPIAH